LAGGLGTRLTTIEAGLPKSMVNVNGQPFIDHQLHLLRRQGVEDVVLCVGHLQQALCQYVGDGTKFGVQVRYSSDGDRLLGTGGAALKASKLSGSPFAVLYGDSYLDLPFAPFAAAFEHSGKAALMTVYRNNNRGIPSNLEVRGGQVVAYNKENPTAAMQHVDFGLSIFSAAAFADFSPAQTFDLTEVVEQLIALGQLACFEVHEPFHEVGSEEGLRELAQYLLTRQQQ